MFAEVLAAHPRLPVVLAHAGMPEFGAALDLVHRYAGVHLDTTMVGVPFSLAYAPLPPDWPARLAAVADRVVLGTDFPNIPYPYAEQLRAIAGWAAADDRLGDAVPALGAARRPRPVAFSAPIARRRGVRDPSVSTGMIPARRGVILCGRPRGRRGGERFRLRMSIEGKRAEEDDDDLVNHAS